MISLDEEALICDLAETYQIYDYRQLPLNRVAVFSCGLRADSRIKMKMNNQLVDINSLLLAGISDKLSTVLWWKTKDGQKGVNRPDSLVDVITNVQPKEKNVIAFSSGEDFINRRNELLKNTKGGK